MRIPIEKERLFPRRNRRSRSCFAILYDTASKVLKFSMLMSSATNVYGAVVEKRFMGQDFKVDSSILYTSDMETDFFQKEYQWTNIYTAAGYFSNEKKLIPWCDDMSARAGKGKTYQKIENLSYMCTEKGSIREIYEIEKLNTGTNNNTSEVNNSIQREKFADAQLVLANGGKIFSFMTLNFNDKVPVVYNTENLNTEVFQRTWVKMDETFFTTDDKINLPSVCEEMAAKHVTRNLDTDNFICSQTVNSHDKASLLFSLYRIPPDGEMAMREDDPSFENGDLLFFISKTIIPDGDIVDIVNNDWTFDDLTLLQGYNYVDQYDEAGLYQKMKKEDGQYVIIIEHEKLESHVEDDKIEKKEILEINPEDDNEWEDQDEDVTERGKITAFFLFKKSEKKFNDFKPEVLVDKNKNYAYVKVESKTEEH